MECVVYKDCELLAIWKGQIELEVVVSVFFLSPIIYLPVSATPIVLVSKEWLMAEPGQSHSAPATAIDLAPGAEGNSIPWGEVRERARRIALRDCDPGQAHLADDIAQESAIKLFENSSRIRIGWKPYLSQIVANTAQTFLKREGNLRRRTCTDSTIVESAADDEPNTHDQVSSIEPEARLNSLLDELDVRFGLGTRAILEFRTEKIPWEEIATIVPLIEDLLEPAQEGDPMALQTFVAPFTEGRAR